MTLWPWWIVIIRFLQELQKGIEAEWGISGGIFWVVAGIVILIWFLRSLNRPLPPNYFQELERKLKEENKETKGPPKDGDVPPVSNH